MKRLTSECVLRPEDLRPSHEGFRVVGAFNPGAVEVDGDVVLLVRVAEQPAERHEGRVGLPRWDPGRGPTVDWVNEDAVEFQDPRAVEIKADRRVRLTFVSHLRAFRSPDGRSFEPLEGGLFAPANAYEVYGVEDPRITPLEGRFWVTYVAVSEHGAATALASTEDFRAWERHGMIFCPENKDVALFPERIRNEYVALHRPNPHYHFTPPEIWLATSPDLRHWGGHRALHTGSGAWESGRIGGGTPPVRTGRGWLEIYHGNVAAHEPGAVGQYSAGALLLDPRDPARVLARSAEPIMVPQEDFERGGFVPGVVFPTGVVRRGECLLVYYGAGDATCGLAELSLPAILAALE